MVFLDRLNGIKGQYTPVWLMRQAGRALKEYRDLRRYYSFLQMCTTPELIAKTTLLPVETLNVDAAILFSDILIPLLALNAKIFYHEGTSPVVDIDINKLSYKGLSNKLNFVFEGIKLIKTLTKKPLIGFAAAPFTLYCYLFNDAKFYSPKAFAYQETEKFKSIMETLTNLTIDYLKAQLQSGCDCFQLFDSWAGILAPKIYKEYVFEYNLKILKTLQKPSIYFAHSANHLVDYILELPANAYSFDWKVDINQISQKTDKCLQGNLDNTILLTDKNTIKKHTIDLLNNMKDKLYIFNLGHGVLPQTPQDNLKFLVDTIHEYNNC
ncbi:uroporphyrinogen decarboxylase [Desulfurella sp.]|uniref:uroporphyrinogen decarboxylase n=1 Tax=Desulfurella sp. TaxID=1962857 RepID=UPI003D09FE6C